MSKTNRNNQRRQKNTKDNLEKNVENPVLQAFHIYSQELDQKHDRHERLVKLSRDITIESKRIIFLLHTIDGRKNNLEKVLAEAELRLNKLIQINFKAIAKELDGYDYYQHRSAYSPGLQEFIEAYYFFEYLKTAGNKISMSYWINLQKKMKYIETTEEVETKENEENITLKEAENLQTNPEPHNYEFFIDPTEWVLGVADLTGELMRRCINSLGSGETDICLETCNTLKQFYTGYTMLNFHRIRDLQRKIYTMRQSVLKTETVCYNVKVRGGEAAKWGAVFDSKIVDDIDEGFFFK